MFSAMTFKSEGAVSAQDVSKCARRSPLLMFGNWPCCCSPMTLHDEPLSSCHDVKKCVHLFTPSVFIIAILRAA